METKKHRKSKKKVVEEDEIKIEEMEILDIKEETPVTPVKKKKRKAKEDDTTDENSNNQMKQTSAKKRRKSVKNGNVEIVDIKTEKFDEDVEEPQDTTVENNDTEKKLPTMPTKDMLQLITKIDSLLPENDGFSYKSRIEKLNWEEVKFGNYTVEECKETWAVLQKPVRKFRLLKEVLIDAKDCLVNPSPKGRRLKLPDMPVKPPLSSYMIFYKKKRDKMLAENPGLDFGELSHKISQMFKALPPEKKLKYETKAAEAKADYEQQLKQFYDNHPEIERPPEKVRKERQHKEVDKKPKKPHAPFFYFFENYLQEQLKANKDISDKSALKDICKEQWKQLNDEKKLIWINWAEKDLLRFEEEVKQYQEAHPDFVPIPIKHVLSKDEVNLRDRLSGKPEKPPNSAYGIFSKMMLQSEEIKTINPKERMNYIAIHWKNSSEKEKNMYKTLQADLQEKYNKEYEKYVESLPEEKKQLEMKKFKKRKLELDESPKKSLSKNNKKTKKLEEPETPPLTAFRYFANVFAYDPKTAKKKWLALAQDEKEKYEKKLMEIKQEYILQFEKFLTSLSKSELVEYSNNKKSTQIEDEFLDVDLDSSSTSGSEASSDEESDDSK